MRRLHERFRKDRVCQVADSSSTSRNLFRRCTDCHVCIVCNAVKLATEFDGAATHCKKCKSFRCDACETNKRRDEFDKRVLSNASHDARNLVCISCQSRGLSPRDMNQYKCKYGCMYGHLQFDKRRPANLSTMLRRRRSARKTLACSLEECGCMEMQLQKEHRPFGEVSAVSMQT